MKRILFFATHDDIELLMSEFEKDTKVNYYLMGNFDKMYMLEYGSYRDIPELGLADSRSATSCASFLVMQKCEEMRVRIIDDARYIVDQLKNPHSIEFTPAGVFSPTVIIHGRFATTSKSEESLRLMNAVWRKMKGSFKKVRAFYVGPAAYGMLRSGARLTISADAGREYDLVELI